MTKEAGGLAVGAAEPGGAERDGTGFGGGEAVGKSDAGTDVAVVNPYKGAKRY